MSPELAVAVVVIACAAAGLGVLAGCGLGSTPRDVLRNAAIAPLAGMAWIGVVAATLATLGSHLSLGGLVLVTIATCGLGVLRMARSKTPEVLAGQATSADSWFDRVAVGTALLAITAVTAYAVAFFRVKPLAEYDGWAMWGMKARALALLGGDPAVFASDAYGRAHLEYPLLLPSLHSLPLQLLDGFSSITVVLSCLAVGLAGLAAVWGLLRDRVRASLLVPFIAALAAAPAFFGQLATGYADVPVAMFVAAGVVAGARWLLDDARSWLALTTLFVAAAALTKNEGLLFGAATYVALLVAAEGRRRPVLLSGMIVVFLYAPWRAYIAIHDLGGAPDYDLSSSFNLPWVVRRLDRAPEASEGLLRRALEEHQFGLLLAVGAAAVVVALVIGPRRLGVLAGGFGVLSFAGLTWIYVLTPNDVSDYLSTNGDRIVVSFVVGLIALSPLLFEESARRLDELRREPAGSSNPSEGPPVASPPGR